MGAEYADDEQPGADAYGADGHSALHIERLFELQAPHVPGDHREIELLAEAGLHARAAEAIGELRFDSLIDQNRAALAQAVCWMNAGRSDLAVPVLSGARRTMAGAWYLACALVRLNRLEEAAVEVLWVGERIPLVGGERRAAQILLRMLGRPLPSWLVDPLPGPQHGDRSRRPPPPPYLASFFYPSRPEVPRGFEDAAEAIQRGRYDDAAHRLVAHRVEEPRVRRLVAVATAECWLMADEPEAAEAWLQHRLQADGAWALACARVQQGCLTGALEPLTWLARRGLLHGDQRDAAAVLVAHLHLGSPPPGLEELDGHELLELARAQEAGYARFAEKVVREVARQRDAEAVERIVHRVVTLCRTIPEDEARNLLVPVYEAAVRASSLPSLAERGLRLLLSRPELLGSDETAYSQALLFATACGELEHFHEQLHGLACGLHDGEARFANWLTAAKLVLVMGDLPEFTHHAGHAADIAGSPEARNRGLRLRRAARWLASDDAPTISQWRLRELHHLLPLEVAERLEDRDHAWLDEVGSASAAAGRAVEAADHELQEAAAIAEDPAGGLPRLRGALGSWALHVGLAVLDSDVARAGRAVPFTGAAWRLLAPDPSAAVFEAHARAVGMACAALREPDLVHATLQTVLDSVPMAAHQAGPFARTVLDRWAESRRAGAGASHGPPDLSRLLRPVSAPPPAPSIGAVLGDLDGIPQEVCQAIERCLADRNTLLPDVPPFRGRRWFDSDTAHRLYQEGRDDPDAGEAHGAFEEAWTREPNNRITIQGLVLSLRRRLREKPGRGHVLHHLADVLDHMAEREVEAALTHLTLAEFAGHDRDRRIYLERAAGALQRRVRRQPWTRARNAEIAIQLELGNLVAAGEAALEESRLYLPGTGPSNRYALLAATLWERAEDPERPPEHRVQAARDRSRAPLLTDREAVQYAVATGSLVVLTDLTLDDDALEDLWRACRGDEDDLCAFLEKQGARSVDPRRHYLEFLAAKLESIHPAAAARIRNWYLAPGAAAEPPRMAWLRLAAAELFTRDPLHEVAVPRVRLGEAHMREFLATLRECAREDEAAYTAFAAAVEDALATLFELREAAPVLGPEPYGVHYARASGSLGVVRRAARRFSSPAVANVAGMVWRYLAFALDAPAVEAYKREKDKRLVASRIGTRLGDWWADLCDAAGPLDFFHHHQSYRCPSGVRPERWLRAHQVHGKPVREAVRELADSLELHARQLDAIEEAYRRRRARREPGSSGFGLRAEFDACCRVLREALAPGTGHQVRAIERALERLGTSLRRIDMSRLVDLPGVLYDSSLPDGCYLLPRAPELLGHWRQNVRDGACLQAICEVQDDSGRDVLCLMCLDAETRPVPESTSLRGLAQFAELVEALGGQLHLWIARPGERAGCRRQHVDRAACPVDEYVARIEKRLRHLAATRWHVERAEVTSWLRVLDSALDSTGSAALAFAILPRLHE